MTPYYIKDRTQRNFLKIVDSKDGEFSIVWCPVEASKWFSKMEAILALNRLAEVHGDFILKRFEVY